MTSAAVCAFVVAGCSAQPSGSAASPEGLARVEQACVDAMVKSRCSVMAGPSAAEGASTVFIAGVGAVDVQAYRALRASGEAMCEVVRRSCEQDWNGQQCVTARHLWTAANTAAP
ncbi:hypothetical protein [Caldimonas brevitalea]|uniref:hypothetical protein n=1 Tax=Caldimonas brevitalea TaxID=413882 RepID=UPI0012F78E68|nr:hypothetical protein [Caldimonas brevitalea]